MLLKKDAPEQWLLAAVVMFAPCPTVAVSDMYNYGYLQVLAALAIVVISPTVLIRNRGVPNIVVIGNR